MKRVTLRRLSVAIAATLAVAAFGVARAGLMIQTGTFALLGGSPRVVSQFWTQRGDGDATILNVRQMQMGSTTPVLKYDIDMERLMHLIVVRDDFATFAHLHPAYDATIGKFSVAFTQQQDHRYFVYADTAPSGIGQQVFVFVLGGNRALPQSKPFAVAMTGPRVQAGPYTVTLSNVNVRARTPLHLNLTVDENDYPAADLTPYLGAAAHVVLIDTGTLKYVHVHPMVRGANAGHGSMLQPTQNGAQMTMNMGGSKMTMPAGAPQAGPFMELELPALPAGTYKAWVQFKGPATKPPYVAAFTIVAR